MDDPSSLFTGVRGRCPTASLNVVSLSDVAFGPLLATFGGVLSIFVTLSLPKCAWRALLGKSFCVSDTVGWILRSSRCTLAVGIILVVEGLAR
jgi:hypothetical protein